MATDLLIAAAVKTPLNDAAMAEEARDDTETELIDLFSKAIAKYLATVQRAVKARLRTGQTVVAAGEPLDPITLGQLAGWWSGIVDDVVLEGVLRAWAHAYAANVGGMPESGVRTAVETYLPRVRDRLVRGIVPPVAEDSMDKIRQILSWSAGLGWTRQETADRIALELDWETHGPSWRAALDDVNRQINAILDPLGPPGSPARESARLNNPTIQLLQADRADLIKQLDAEQTYWQNRAMLIARTESTSLHGYAANRALAEEGWQAKKWMATHDARTRPEHAEADGQTVPVDGEFIVGGFTLAYPGDPSAPVGMIANCRCTMVGADQLEAPEGVDADAASPH